MLFRSPSPTVATPTPVPTGDILSQSLSGVPLDPTANLQNLPAGDQLNIQQSPIPQAQVPASQVNPLAQYANPVSQSVPNFSAGLDRLSSAQGFSDFIGTKGYGMDLAKAAIPLALSASGSLFKQQGAPGPVASSSSVPAGNQLKYNSPNFVGTQAPQPTTYYTAKYPNYVSNPYNPYAVAASAKGGLQEVEKMAQGGYSFPSIYGNTGQSFTGSTGTSYTYNPKANYLVGNTTTTPTPTPTFQGHGHQKTPTPTPTPTPAPTPGTPNTNIYQPNYGNTPGTMQGNVYMPEYVNYQTNPYIMSSAGGGLQHVARMKSGDLADTLQGYQEFEEGIAGLKRQPINVDMPGPGIYQDSEQGMSTASPMDRANMLWTMASKHLPKKQLAAMTPSKATDLTSIPTQTALEAQQAADAASAQSIAQSPQPTSAKEGGLQNLGHYSDGGHLLRGPGDGVSDSIPATIGGKQPARLADGEFVIPARIVSELGNGSTDAGAKRLYAMMDRIKAKRAKAKDIAANTKAYEALPV